MVERIEGECIDLRESTVVILLMTRVLISSSWASGVL